MHPKVIIKTKKLEALKRFHPWVFSGAIARIQGKAKDGDIVHVCDHHNNVLATGHYHEGSIAVRILAFEEVELNKDFWLDKLQKAYALRKRLGLSDSKITNAYRLIHGEGDGFSGLIVDIYDKVAVFQAHSIGMHKARTTIAEALRELYGEELQGIYDKSKNSLPKVYAENLENDYIWSNDLKDYTTVVQENTVKFEINWQTGQKTGFFLDQRENRAILGKHCVNKTVLNAFCYSGGFSLYALKAGAAQVDSVDISPKAIDLVERNVEINKLKGAKHKAYKADVLEFLKSSEQDYDIVILDPPAYAKSIKKRHRAVQGYKRLNIEGLKRVKKGGLLFTFSCSQVVNTTLFYNTITAAAIESGRNIRVLQHLSQGADHPVSIFHPEGSYLKGLILYVE
ncbi:MAG: class I SAM-dependent rRNA methyltransferase [Saprospiraceae bacterium]|nr:class I SAM-dependent rRNA methyltransferase [Saprospiraceae bacterium]